MNNITEFLSSYLSTELVVMIISMFPLIEVKGAIPIGVHFGLPLTKSFFLSYIGSLVPMPFIILFIRNIFNWLKSKNILSNYIDKRMAKSNKSYDKIKGYEKLGLFIFVAIPLPGTGVWAGSLLASIMNMRLKTAVPIISIGNLISSSIIALLSEIIIV